MGIVVEKPGILTTVQDAGRLAISSMGYPPQGLWIPDPFNWRIY